MYTSIILVRSKGEFRCIQRDAWFVMKSLCRGVIAKSIARSVAVTVAMRIARIAAKGFGSGQEQQGNSALGIAPTLIAQAKISNLALVQFAEGSSSRRGMGN